MALAGAKSGERDRLYIVAAESRQVATDGLAGLTQPIRPPFWQG